MLRRPDCSKLCATYAELLDLKKNVSLLLKTQKERETSALQESSSLLWEPLKNDEMRGAGEERSKPYVAYGVEHRSQQRRSSRFSEVP